MTPRRARGDRRARRGLAAVEGALLLPVLFVLLTGVVEWGYFLGRSIDLDHVTRDAAAAGSRVRSADGPAAHARARCLSALAAADFDSAAAQIAVTQGTATAGTTLSVSVVLPYAPLGGLLPMPSALRASTTVRMQNK